MVEQGAWREPGVDRPGAGCPTVVAAEVDTPAAGRRWPQGVGMAPSTGTDLLRLQQRENAVLCQERDFLIKRRHPSRRVAVKCACIAHVHGHMVSRGRPRLRGVCQSWPRAPG